MSSYPLLPPSTYNPQHAAPTTPLYHQPQTSHPPSSERRGIKVFSGIFIATIFVVSLVLIIINQREETSELVRGNDECPWTNSMLSWQRTSYHFQPERNWMNDPNGPLFHMGWYHFFYQYNPNSAMWGNITWGHAVSKDLIHWLHLPFAMVPDSWFDISGVWTGSATILPDGQIVMLYTGGTDDLVQVQNLACPKNISDPLLLEWVKYPGNPVIVPPPGIGLQDFRDPTTAWLGENGKWLIAIGSKIRKTGVSLVYETTNFTSFKLLDGILHSVPGTGMWECVDFYPISTVNTNGLDTSSNGPNTKHVLKASTADDRHDYYAIGTYDPLKNKWVPDNEELDVGIGLKLDYGMFYASKTFYDNHKQRRILWGWTGETDSEGDDLLKGWASLQTIPRTVVFDKKVRTNILQWPVEEIETLRSGSTEYNDVKLQPGSIVPLKPNASSATQFDIVASFKVDREALKAITVEANVEYDCSNSGGAAARGLLGPFGLVVVADEKLTELTPIYFYMAKYSNGKTEVHFCADQLRSSQAFGAEKVVYGSTIQVLEDEDLTMRLLVDHSIVESFAQEGRMVITSRIYPTTVMNGVSQIFVFNNATGISVTASVKIWDMESANIHNFSLN